LKQIKNKRPAPVVAAGYLTTITSAAWPVIINII